MHQFHPTSAATLAGARHRADELQARNARLVRDARSTRRSARLGCRGAA